VSVVQGIKIERLTSWQLNVEGFSCLKFYRLKWHPWHEEPKIKKHNPMRKVSLFSVDPLNILIIGFLSALNAKILLLL
jgi:hypothetical protein